MKILIATGNQHKVSEISQILTPLGYELLSANDVGGIPEVIEDGDTFAANAVKKAVEVAAAKQLPTIADDSGLEVLALNREPGIYSARYGGDTCKSDQDRCELLLRNMLSVKNRGARFVCVIAIATPDGKTVTAEGEVTGEILHKMTGKSGFGYDPIFQPNGHERSFAQMSGEEKDAISHRGKALKQACKENLFEILK
ncbi:MAG: RdgB/HAM1 family non-canonical purine NTP pyrophosphatase [Lentisphaeria bacterium]|nr:RdgB/HAM1 family non-canonical purine NTP pyrophosphatase [Lentisphaeria bacterium]